jgi:hypothetical protein
VPMPRNRSSGSQTGAPRVKNSPTDTLRDDLKAFRRFRRMKRGMLERLGRVPREVCLFNSFQFNVHTLRLKQEPLKRAQLIEI